MTAHNGHYQGPSGVQLLLLLISSPLSRITSLESSNDASSSSQRTSHWAKVGREAPCPLERFMDLIFFSTCAEMKHSRDRHCSQTWNDLLCFLRYSWKTHHLSSGCSINTFCLFLFPRILSVKDIYPAHRPTSRSVLWPALIFFFFLFSYWPGNLMSWIDLKVWGKVPASFLTRRKENNTRATQCKTLTWP